MAETIVHLCDLCGEDQNPLQLGQFYVTLPDVDLIHAAHSASVDTDTGEEIDICYDCTPSVSDWLSSSCSLCGDRVDHVFRYKRVGRADFQFITCIDCSGWDLKEE